MSKYTMTKPRGPRGPYKKKEPGEAPSYKRARPRTPAEQHAATIAERNAAERIAAEWNAKHAIGTRVRFQFEDRPAETHTTTGQARAMEDAGSYFPGVPVPTGALNLKCCTPIAASYETLSRVEYSTLSQAYDKLNDALFDGALPPVLITLQRHAGSRGYFHAHRFASRKPETELAVYRKPNPTLKEVLAEVTTHELALNPDTFKGRTDAEILSTLAHEMCHVWQETYGKAPRTGYHDRQWADKMIEIGLQPSDTGQLGGKEVGPRVSHYIMDGGRYAQTYAALAAAGLKLNWQSRTDNLAVRKKKKASKTKYTCEECGVNAWAKPGAALICGECHGDENNILMLAEEEEAEA